MHPFEIQLSAKERASWAEGLAPYCRKGEDVNNLIPEAAFLMRRLHAISVGVQWTTHPAEMVQLCLHHGILQSADPIECLLAGLSS